jgi:hypothetical protein
MAFDKTGDVPQKPTSKAEHKPDLNKIRKREFDIMGSAPQLYEIINSGIGNLEANVPMIEPPKPKRRETIWRTITSSQDSLPEEAQLDTATKDIIAKLRSIRDMLLKSGHLVTSRLDQEECQQIAFLLSLAKANNSNILGKELMKKSNDKPDERSKKEIKRKLDISRKINNILDQWQKFMNGTGEKPSLANTFALGLEQANMRVETIDDHLKQRGNFLTFYEIPKLWQTSKEQTSEEEAIKAAWKRLNELRSELARQAPSAAKSKDLNSLIDSVMDHIKRVTKYVELYEDYMKKIGYEQSPYIAKHRKKERFKEFIQQLQPVEDSSQQGGHYYEVFDRICGASGENTLDKIFAIMKSRISLLAPVWQKGPVESDTKIKIPMLGTVKPIFDEASHTVIHLTSPGHLLYPGVVLRQIVQRGNEIGVLTVAIAYGVLSHADKKLAAYVWRLPNGALKKAFKDQKLGD